MTKLNTIFNGICRSAALLNVPTSGKSHVLIIALGALARFAAVRQNPIHHLNIHKASNLSGFYYGMTSLFFQSLPRKHRIRPFVALGVVASALHCFITTLQHANQSNDRETRGWKYPSSIVDTCAQKFISIGIGALTMRSFLAVLSQLNKTTNLSCP